MSDDENTWSEKGRGSGRGKRPPKEQTAPSSGDDVAVPERPSKRAAAAAGAAGSEIRRVPATESGAGARKVARAAATAGQRDVSFASRLGFPAIVALVCLLGIGIVFYAWSVREPLVKPRIGGVDHWHAVYGVYDCTQPGTEKYLPQFLSDVDAGGIHSHGDGIIHIHPFLDATSGSNAKIKHFLTEMDVSVEDGVTTLDNGRQLIDGTECADGSGPAEMRLLKWNFEISASGDNRQDPDEVVTGADMIETKFNNDRELYIFAFASPDTPISELPLPPADRFETLDRVTPDLDYTASELTPSDSGVSVTGETEDGQTIEGTDEPVDE